MKDFQQQIVNLIRAALTDYVPNHDENYDFEKIFSLADNGGYTSLIYYGALKTPKFNAYEGKKTIIRQVCYEIARSRKQMEEVDAFSAYMDNIGADYCLLKGTELKPLYPHPEMRPMNDSDILVYEKDIKSVNKYLLDSGFKFLAESSMESVWAKTGIEIEIHTRLMEFSHDSKTLYFNTAWEHLDGHYLDAEFSFLYQLVHLAKHSALGTMPLRHLVDMFVYTKAHPEINMQEIEKQLKEMHLADFFHNVMELVDCWFNGAQPTELTDLMTDMAFMTREERNDRVMYSFEIEKRDKSKLSYMFTRVFKNYGSMCDEFPILMKYPVLLPLYWFIRAFGFIFNRKKQDSAKNNLNNYFDNQKLESFENEMETIGLKEWYQK
ncbi:MAG: nucleotidyltransferase family protein [Ruminococcus sp.]|nr:nucleotidyltransferase family protein [Candidatus Copronaster equi]